MSRKSQTARVLERENDELKRLIAQLKRQITALRRRIDEDAISVADVRELLSEEIGLSLSDLQETPKIEEEQLPKELGDLVFILPNGQERRVKRRPAA
jgi:type II secretory pathway component PulJ